MPTKKVKKGKALPTKKTNNHAASHTVAKIKSLLSEKQIKHYKDILISTKMKILDDINQIEDQNLNSHKDSAGDLSGYSLHMADVGTDNFDRELALDVVGNEHDILYQIDKALERMDHGVYGICEMLQIPIPIAILDAIPWTPYSKEAAEKIEKGR